MTVPKYRPYRPTNLESRIDRLVRLVSPRTQAQRVINREREHYFRYMSAYPTSSRRNSNAMTSGETLKGSREKLQVMWNAINAVENSGLCTSIVTKFQMYVCGTLKWQSRCGVRDIATQYEDYMKTALGASLDVTGRYSLRQMAMLDLRSILIKGDVGTNIVRNGNQIQLQGIEADRIGNPYDYTITNNYVRGLELDDNGGVTGVRIFYRDRPTGMYKYESTIPMRDKRGMPQFLFLSNPIGYDDYRGISVFKTAIDNATYIDRIREYELQALMWAASQSGVFHTKSGVLPEGLPFDKINPLQDASGNPIDTYQVRPNTVTALGVGEEVNMFQHDRPSPNVLGMLEATIRDISVGTGLSYGMVWDMGGFTGPAVRAVSSQDARTIEVWQWLLRESKLDPVAMLVLGNAIANGELPMTPNWMKWEWFFPAKSTIDVGRESEANIAEIHAGINTGSRIAANDGQDIEEIKIQRGLEVEAEIEIAQKVATDVSTDGQPVMWQEVYQLMCPKPGRGGGGMPGMGFPPGGDGGGDSGGGGGGNGAVATRGAKGNGSKKMRVPAGFIDEELYSDDQPRDDHGRFADEGKGGNGGPKTLADLDVSTQPADEEGKGWQMHYAHDKGDKIPRARMMTSPEPDKTTAIRLLESAQEGKGYGSSLIQHADAVAKGQGSERIISDPEGGTKERAGKMLEKNGYTKVPHPTAPEGHVYEKQLPGDFDKQVADYKPDRTLADPTKTTPIYKAVPGVSFTPYSKTPFFKDVNALQGAAGPNPLARGVKDYVEQRKLLFETIPSTKITLNNVVATQEMVNTDRVAELASDPTKGGDKAIYVVQKDGKQYILNGHHRVAGLLAKGGHPQIDAHVLDLDHPPPVLPKDDADVPRYINDLHSVPEFKTLNDRLHQLGADNGSRENYTFRQGLNEQGRAKLATGAKVDAFTPDDFTPEAAKNHEEAVVSQLNPKAAVPEGKHPDAVLLIGPPAAGKSSAALPEIKKDYGELTTISADNSRERLTQYRGWNTPATQEEAKYVNAQVVERAIGDRHNVVFDEVGAKFEKIGPRVLDLKKAGYNVHVVFVDAPMHQTVPRAWDRFKHEGRYTDTSYMLNEVDYKPGQVYDKLKAMPEISSWTKRDNTDFQNKVVEQGSR